MSHWNNFPASSFMTDFEIVVVQNERARMERQRLKQEQVHAQTQDHLQNPALPHDPVPSIHPTLEDSLIAQAHTPQKEVEHSQINSVPICDIVIDENITLITNDNQLETQTISNDQTQKTNLGNDSSSSGTYQSFNDESQENNSSPKQIPFRNNTTVFMSNINEFNVNRGKRTILISAVRPSFQCLAHNEFYICHVCQKKPRTFKISEQLSDMGNDKRGNELPFAYNLRGIIDHLTKFHCETHEDKSRDMVRKVAGYIDNINIDIEEGTSPMFCWMETIPKASSTSCLDSTWKSNQTDLTLDISQFYDFQHHTKNCNGHLKLKAVQGLAYTLDLADTVYCSCNAIIVKPRIHVDLPPPEVILNPGGNLTLGTQDHQEHSMAEVILDPTLNTSPDNSFFHLEKLSIFQFHKAVLCHYKIFQSLPDFPTRTFLPQKPTTRGDTAADRTLNDHQDTSAEDGSYDSEDESSGHNRSGPGHQTSTKIKAASCPTLQSVSCHFPPPGQVRLPPDGKSPPMPPNEHQGQPPAGPAGGSSIKSIVGQGLATAACLLKPSRPKVKSQWL